MFSRIHHPRRPQDLVPPERVHQPLLLHQIDLAAEQLDQLVAQVEPLFERWPLARFVAHQHVDITIVPWSAADARAEEGHLRDVPTLAEIAELAVINGIGNACYHSGPPAYRP